MIKINCNIAKKCGFIIGVLWLASVVSILVVDRSLAIFIHQYELDKLLILRNITEGMPIVSLIIVCIVLFIYYWKTANRKVTAITTPIYFYLVLRLSMEIKTGLKIIFGRYWPKTWVNNNLSLIHDGIYGFNWFHGFGNQGSFPSGHSTYMAFCTLWLIIYYPKLRYLWLALMLVCIFSLIILDYHFLGDCLAGAGLGILCGLVFISIWQKVTGKVIVTQVIDK